MELLAFFVDVYKQVFKDSPVLAKLMPDPKDDSKLKEHIAKGLSFYKDMSKAIVYSKMTELDETLPFKTYDMFKKYFENYENRLMLEHWIKQHIMEMDLHRFAAKMYRQLLAPEILADAREDMPGAFNEWVVGIVCKKWQQKGASFAEVMNIFRDAFWNYYLEHKVSSNSGKTCLKCVQVL